MEFSVKLARLPDEMKFPERLKDRFHYDETKRALVFRGFMTKCTYDEVSALSDDPDYHRAIERLFVLTSNEVTPHSALPLPKWSAAVVLATAGAAVVGAAMWWGFTRQAASAAPALPDPAATVTVAR